MFEVFEVSDGYPQEEFKHEWAARLFVAVFGHGELDYEFADMGWIA